MDNLDVKPANKPKKTLHIVLETAAWSVFALMLGFTFLLWAIIGRNMYQGCTFYYEDDISSIKYGNLSFIPSENGAYTAKIFGCIPVGQVNLCQRNREYVTIPKGGVLCGIDVGGWLVEHVYDSEPADIGGLKPGYLIVSIDGNSLADGASSELSSQITQPNSFHTFECIDRAGNNITLRLHTNDEGRFGFEYRTIEPVLGTLSFVKDGFFFAYGHSVGALDYDYGAWQVGLLVSDKSVDFIDRLADDMGTVLSYSPVGVVGIVGNDWQMTDMTLPVAWFWEMHMNSEASVLIGCEDGSWSSYKGIVTKHTAVYTPDDPLYSVQYDYQVKLTDGNIFKSGLSGSPVIQDGKLIGVLAAVSVEDPSIGYFCTAERALDTFEYQVNQYIEDMQSIQESA